MDQPLPTQIAPAPDPSAPVDWSRVTAPAPESPIAAFGAGWLIARTFATWGRNVLRFAPLGVVSNAPMAAGQYLLYAGMTDLARSSPLSLDRVRVMLGAFGVAALVAMALYPLMMGAISRGTVQGLRGKRVRLGDMLAAGGRAYLRLLVMGILVSLAMIPATLLLVFPAIILMVGWSAAVAAAVEERTGPVRSLSRSWALTRGHRWRVFAGIAVAWIAIAVAAGLFQAATLGGMMALVGTRAMAPGPAMAIPMGVYQLLVGALNTVLYVACAVAYHGLRAAKEGGDPETLAQVFA
ncbi:MAG TPA: hypothetical protein VMU15_01710 [Anaeromyxobacter sp.]|nr:hypothetical protein [Anaeromyxobacter sp.]